MTVRPLIALSLLAATVALANASSPVMAQSSSIAGLWRTPVDGGGTVRIAPCGSDVCGTVVSSPRLRANPDQRDARNTDARLRDRPLRGLTILRATPDGAGRWTDGWVYNPEDGKTYRGSLQLTPDGKLRVTGCVVRPLCRTQTWERSA